MAKQFLCRLGLVQLSVNPAYADELVTDIQEPTFRGEGDPVGLSSVAGIEEINTLRQKISDRYVTHLGRKLEATLRFAAACGVELLLLPEYSVPPQLLLLCRHLSDELQLALVAGTHVATLNSEAQRVYRELDLPLAKHPTTAEPSASVGQALCVVFLPRQKTLTFAKSVLSKWERSLVPGDSPSHVFEMNARAGKIEVQILICIEALSSESVGKKKHSQPRLVVIPAFTPSAEPFHHFGSLSLSQGYCTLFANVSEFGGSKAFARCDGTRVWFAEQDGSIPVPAGSEALLVLTADLEAQFEIRKSTRAHFAVSELRVHPVLYTADSVEAQQYVQLTEAIPPAATLEQVAAVVKPFTNLTPQVFPQLLQNKLDHFCSHLVPAGVVSATGSKSWLQPLVVSDTPSTNRLRYELSSEAIAVVNELQMSGRYPLRASDLLRVYGHLVTKRNELVPLINLRETSEQARMAQVEQEARPSGGHLPFMDRLNVLDKIQAFMNQDQQCAFLLSGMKGIGKSSLIEAAFRQVIPPNWRKVRLWLTEGVSASRLLGQLGYACNLPLPQDLDLSSPDKQNDMEQRIVSYLSKSPAAVIVFDDFQFLLNASGEIEDKAVEHLFHSLFRASGRTRTKYFLASDVAPRLGAAVESWCAPCSLRGLEKEDTARLLSYWFQFQHDVPTGRPPAPSERLVAVLGGHPLATKVAARLWAEHPSQDISRDMILFKELRDTIVTFILEKLPLSEGEIDLMLFASILRIPAPRELFVRWKGETANNLLNSLTCQYLLESSAEGYQLHPLVRDYYFQSLSVADSVKLHRVAGKFYSDWFEKEKKTTGRLVPELLGEAVHHYLGALEIKKVRDLAFFKTELRPIARSHYQKNDFRTALKEYTILVDLDDQDADAHYHLGRIYAREDRWDEAELHFGKAMSLLPKACWILHGYAAAKRHAGRLEEARQLLERSLKINPSHSATLFEMGRLCEIYRDITGAEEYYEKAIQTDPDNFRAYTRLARLLYNEGSFEEALEMIEAAVATNPRDRQAKELLAELQKKIEKSQEDRG
jgi:tetratricopeptide (TPR) repeat protein